MLRQRFEFFCGAIVDADLVPAIDEPARHGLTHAAKPDKSDLHDVYSYWWSMIFSENRIPLFRIML